MTTRGPTTAAVVALCLVQFADVMGVTVMVTAAPRVLLDVHAPAADSGLLTTGYAMSFGGLLMLGARLGDVVGHRRAVLIGLATSAVGAVVAASATSVAALTVGRGVQGAAAALAVPSALRLLTTITSGDEARRRALAAWSATGAAAGAAGFLVGGVVVQAAGWRVIFWGGLSLAAVLTVMVVRCLPRDGDVASRTPLNVVGSTLFTGAIMAVIVAMTMLSNPGAGRRGVLVLVLAAVLGTAFIVEDARSPAPLLPRPLLRQPSLRWGAAGAWLNTATTSSLLTLATLYLQDARHVRPLGAALRLLPFSVAVAVGAGISTKLLRRFADRRCVASGLGMIAVGDLVTLAIARTGPGISVGAAVAGLGIGLSSVATTQLGTSVELRWRGTAAGVLNTAAQTGTAIGVAALVLLATVTTGTTGHDEAGPTIAWAVGAAASLLGAVAFARSATRTTTLRSQRTSPATAPTSRLS